MQAEWLAKTARLMGEPARARFLLVLGDGRALPAGELAACAGITAQTASGHLSRLVQAGLLTVVRQGRHRYYRIASPEVAAMVEAVMGIAARAPAAVHSRVEPALREGRTCYHHLAGRLGVGLCDALVGRGAVVLEGEGARITAEGLTLLDAWGIETVRMRRHPYGRTCIDWSERRPHLAGAVGIAIHQRCLTLGWIAPHLDSRAVRVTPVGAKGFQTVFGVVVTKLPSGDGS